MNFLFNTHPRVATAQLMVSVSLAVIDAYGKSYTAIAKEFDVVKTPQLGCKCMAQIRSADLLQFGFQH